MNPAVDIWAKVLAPDAEREMTTTTINTWFDDTTAVELRGPLRPLLPTPSNGYHRQPVSSAIQNDSAELFSGRISGDCAHRGELDRYQQPKTI